MTAQQRWYLDEPLDLNWRGKALCRSRQDLPWTPDVEPDRVSFVQMRALCNECPVAAQCAAFGLSQSGGFYAGVWTPWKDGSPAGEERGARYSARTALRGVRDSATHEDLPLNTSRSRRDARPVSLSAR